MQPLRRHHARTLWVALLLFALATLAPTVSRAMAHVQGQIAPWATLCSAADGSGGTSPADALKHLTEHCPTCHLLADHLAPPPAASAGLPGNTGAHRLPPLAAPAQAGRPLWGLFQPRAPPRTA